MCSLNKRQSTLAAMADLKQKQPLMKVAGIEFKQRLQWLSEGMLKNHINCNTLAYKVDQKEIADYRDYKMAVAHKKEGN